MRVCSYMCHLLKLKHVAVAINFVMPVTSFTFTLSFLLFLTEQVLKLSEKKQMDYSIVIHWLRAKPSFNLLMKISSVVSKRLQINLAKHELNTDFSGAEIANVIGKMKLTRKAVHRTLFFFIQA